MQNLFSFSFALAPQCLGPDQYKEESSYVFCWENHNY